jgi:hypothetical protein
MGNGGVLSSNPRSSVTVSSVSEADRFAANLVFGWRQDSEIRSSRVIARRGPLTYYYVFESPRLTMAGATHKLPAPKMRPDPLNCVTAFRRPPIKYQVSGSGSLTSS